MLSETLDMIPVIDYVVFPQMFQMEMGAWKQVLALTVQSRQPWTPNQGHL